MKRSHMDTDARCHGSADCHFPKWLLISLITFALVIISWQTLVCGGVTEICDTWSYFRAWEILKRLHPDTWRPPTYPLLLGPIFEIFPESVAMVMMLLIQWGIWIAGSRSIWLTVRYFGISKTYANSIVILLMVFPGAWVLNNVLQTDGPATGLLPILVWEAVKYREKPRKGPIVWSGILLFALIYLKPQFIYIPPIWAIAWIYLTYDNKRHLWIALAFSIGSVFSLLFYKWSLYHCYRQNSFSIVAPFNNYYSLRCAGLIKLDEIENEKAREILRPLIEADPGSDLHGQFLYWDEVWMVPTNTLDSIVTNAYGLHMTEAHLFALRRIPSSLGESIFFHSLVNRSLDTPRNRAYYEALGTMPDPDPVLFVTGRDLFTRQETNRGLVIYPLYKCLDIPFWIAWMSMAVFTIWYITVWWKHKRFPVIAFYIAALLWGGYATVFIGAPCEWGRLVTPFTMLLFAAGGIMVANVKKTLSGLWLKRREFA